MASERPGQTTLGQALGTRQWLFNPLAASENDAYLFTQRHEALVEPWKRKRNETETYQVAGIGQTMTEVVTTYEFVGRNSVWNRTICVGGLFFKNH